MAERSERNRALEEGEDRPEIVGSTAAEYEQALSVRPPVAYVLTLYVAGAAPRSLRAIADVRRLCQEHLSDCHELQVVDIYQEPSVAERDGVLAVPVLVRKLPPPERSFIGDMSDFDRVLKGLGLAYKSGAGE